MNPAPFEYHQATSVDEALRLLAEYEEDGAKLIAGGHSLLPLMKLRLAEPGHLIDLSEIDDLKQIRRDGDWLELGAMVTHRQIEHDQTVAGACPLLVQVAKVVGDRQVRARGTIGGALAHADPAADYPAAALALGAKVVAQGPNGTRTIAIDDFFVDLLTTALEPDEVITLIRVPVAAPGSGSNYQKLANQASGYAIVGVASVLARDEHGTCASARIGVTGAGAVAYRAKQSEEALVGSAMDEAAIGAAADLVAEGVDVMDDLHASQKYRRRVVKGLARRAIQAAWAGTS